MMYPRLYLARNLLRDDGVIFISIDDHEMHHLIQLGGEVFGEENLLGAVTVVSNWKGRSDALNFASAHDSVVVYARNSFVNLGLPLPDRIAAAYTRTDEATGRRFRLLPLRKSGSNSLRSDRPNMYFPLYVDPESRAVSTRRDSPSSAEVWPLFPDGREGCWRWGLETVDTRSSDLVGVDVRGRGWDVYERDWMDRSGAERRVAPKTVWSGPEYSSDAGTYEVKKLLGEGVFPHPKPIGLVATALEMAVGGGDIVLDFFAGSGTTAHAVLDLNAQDGGNRKFILVQLPEPTERDDYPTIADITKERVRRVIAKLNQEKGEADDQDRGFRVFKLAESSFNVWDAQGSRQLDAFEEQLRLHVDNVRDERSADDVLFELLLKSGYPLSATIEPLELAGKRVFSVAEGALLVCLDRGLSLELMRAVAERKPERFVVLDEGFAGNDQLKANAVQIFKAADVTFRTV
jgi:adenine-specific DNA-methyltransferase